MSDIYKTLDKREETHGRYEFTAFISQQIKAAMRLGSWHKLTPSMQESLELIATKMGRILSGNPHNTEHWHDIAGYATLEEEILKQSPKQEKLKTQLRDSLSKTSPVESSFDD